MYVADSRQNWTSSHNRINANSRTYPACFYFYFLMFDTPCYTHDDHFSYVLNIVLTLWCFVCTLQNHLKMFLHQTEQCKIYPRSWTNPILNVIRCRLSRIGHIKQQSATKTPQSFHRGRAKQDLLALQEDIPIACLYAHSHENSYR